MDSEAVSQSLLKLNFDQVYLEEQNLIQQKRERRIPQDPGTKGQRFALAFSGGGIRAAAFQAGVLWRLAATGRLKDVDYFSAVSGGAYIAAAFASHAITEDEPPKGSSLDGWYRSVVAKTILRMQENAGDFIRDPFKADKKSHAGNLPRVCDLPLLLLTFAFTVVIVPVELLIVFLIPIVEGLYLFFGAALRVSVCSNDSKDHWKVLSEWSPFGMLVIMFEVCVGITFFLWLLHFLPPFQLGEKDKHGKYRCAGYLWRNSAMAFLTRFTIALLVLAAFVVVAPSMQLFTYQDAMRRIMNNTEGGFCMAYMSMGGDLIMKPGAESGCVNIHHGRTWYEDANLRRLPGSGMPYTALQRGQQIPETTVDVAQSVLTSSRSIMSFVLGILALLLLVAVVLVPFFPDAFLAVLWLTGPLVAFCCVAILLQYRVFGPLTGQPLFFSWFPFKQKNWDMFVEICLALLLVVIPFYNDLRRFWHWFYLRSLRMSFFAKGSDQQFDEAGKCAYLPFLMFTGTVNDFKRPGVEETITEITFSPLHTGSEVTGYLRTPRYRTLAKCTALTSAGCLDAITLSLHNHLRFRFLLEMLNLSWGDYILFDPKRGALHRLAERTGLQCERFVIWTFHRLPTLTIWFITFGLVWGSWMLSASQQPTVCNHSRTMMGTAALLAVVTFGTSFFAHQQNLSWLLFSPIIRQMHQATQFFFQSNKPPPLLYVTDGGVKDCTSIVQLIRRRCERILLVLANADPDDELNVFRTTMQVVADERLGSFYDPTDAKRDVRIVLEEFQAAPEQRYLHLGIRYGWTGDQEEVALGTLVVVKNRLPPSMTNLTVRPLLSKEELEADTPDPQAGWGIGPDTQEGWRDLKVTDLGGVPCCDCCHRSGCNCGVKFPHLTGANYLWLTPRLFSSLCRLGHDLSEEALCKLLE